MRIDAIIATQLLRARFGTGSSPPAAMISDGAVRPWLGNLRWGVNHDNVVC